MKKLLVLIGMLCLPSALMAVGCGDDAPALMTGESDATTDDDTGTEEDAGEDAAEDAGEDATEDAAEDTGSDAAEDAGEDAAEDAGADAAEDTGADAAEDAGTDAAEDAGGDAAEDAGEDAMVAAPTDDDIEALFAANCVPCHTTTAGPGGSAPSAADWSDVSALDETYVVNGDPENSELYRRITGAGPGALMPQGGPAMSDADIALVEAWITNRE